MHGGPSGVKARQTACVRTAPPSASQKRGGCGLLAMGLDGTTVACLLGERREGGGDGDGETTVPWLTVLPGEEVACAGNEGLVDEDRVGYYDLRGAVVDFLKGDASDPLRDALLSAPDGGDVAEVSVSPALDPCGNGHYLFHAHVFVFGYSELGPEGIPATPGAGGHRLFVFSSRTGSIAACHRLGDEREGTLIFASDPAGTAGGTARTWLLVAGPTMPSVFLSVEVRRDGAVGIAETSTIAARDLAPWSEMRAALSTSGGQAVLATDPVPGPTLHFYEPGVRGEDEGGRAALRSVSAGGQDSRVHGLFMVGEEHAAVIVGKRPADDDDDAVAGEWFGLDESSFEIALYHLESRQEIYRSAIASGDATVDHAGGCLAASVSDLGFVLAGEGAREVARSGGERDGAPLRSPGVRSSKAKKKRLASLASGRKKDGFARGMSLRG